MENLPKHAWILCVRHNLLLAELCALRARCLLFQMLSIIVSTPSGIFKADRLYLLFSYFHLSVCCPFSAGYQSDLAKVRRPWTPTRCKLLVRAVCFWHWVFWTGNLRSLLPPIVVRQSVGATLSQLLGSA